ncbi:uncharacterized protein PG986_002362 [Apiospora aurea]|uniref:Uncharacterized protein n=1 Tax=Apiospora aurea TaxID=335848 RepID=A0ABR1R1B0_9PEZI
MPKLIVMSLHSYSGVNPRFEFGDMTVLPLTEEPSERPGPYVEIWWDLPSSAYSKWMPSNKVLRLWHTIAAKKRGSELWVDVLNLETNATIYGRFPTCVDGKEVPFSCRSTDWKVDYGQF